MDAAVMMVNHLRVRPLCWQWYHPTMTWGGKDYVTEADTQGTAETVAGQWSDQPSWQMGQYTVGWFAINILQMQLKVCNQFNHSVPLDVQSGQYTRCVTHLLHLIWLQFTPVCGWVCVGVSNHIIKNRKDMKRKKSEKMVKLYIIEYTKEGVGREKDDC